MPPPTISVIIISHNEAHDIQACLASVSWADHQAKIYIEKGGFERAPQEPCAYYQEENPDSIQTDRIHTDGI